MAINLNTVMRDMQSLRLNRYELHDKYSGPRKSRVLSDYEDAIELDNATRVRDMRGY
jgi:hypothetical protein